MTTCSVARFRDLLLECRRSARLSQLDLALEAGISQRHLSFLETGRSQPGREVAASLARALRLPPAAANALLHAAGFSPLFPARGWAEAAMAPVRSAATAILSAHMPCPAVLIDEAGDVLEANDAFEKSLSLLGDPADIWRRTHGTKARNLLRLSHHPEGPAAAMINFETVAKATLARAMREAPHSTRLQAVLDEIALYPNIDPAWMRPAWEPATSPVIEEHYRVGDRAYSVFAVVTTLGAPMDLTAGSLRIESFFPVDDATRALMDAAFQGHGPAVE